MKKSVWSEEVKLPKFDKLKGEVSTDVLVIGGGLCGILCAYFLQESGVDYVLVEGRRIASGITKNTTAKITSQHGLIYSKLINDVGRENARKYLEANQNALREYERLCESIECDFEKRSAYTYSLNDRQKIIDELETVKSLGFKADFAEKTELPFDIAGAICFPNQAQFNPLEFISEISKGLNIYENTFVREITPHTAITEDGKINAKKIVVTTHFPFINKHGSYFLKLYQHRSYVSAYENVPKLRGMYVDEDKKGMSFRTYGNLLLVGGGGHRTGKQGGNWNEIDEFVSKNFPLARLKYRWAAQDCMSLDNVPYIGKYSKNTEDMYVATGFNKWGFTSAMVAATILSDMILGNENEYVDVFSPQRSILKPQLVINGIEATMNLLTPTSRRCPHLGCALKWNKAEHTWDCPCHGSRFEEYGRLIDNPATGDANVD